MLSPTATYIASLVRNTYPDNGIEFLSAILDKVATPNQIGILVTELEIDQIRNLQEGKAK